VKRRVVTLLRDFPDASVALKHLRNALIKNPQSVAESFLLRYLTQPTRRLVQILKREFKRSVMHRHKPLCPEVLENLHRLVWSHMDVAERFRMIRPDWKQCDFRAASSPNFLEPIKISAIAGVINPPALMFQHETAVPAMVIAQNPGAPMLAGC